MFWNLNNIVILLFSIFLGCYVCDKLEKQEKSCFVANKLNNESAWKLVWEDGFDGKNLSETDWDVQHESVFCSGNGIQQVSCNVLSNVHLHSGTLSLWAQRENYYEYQYTAATVTTRRFFSFGRWEFRLALPLGKQLRATVFTRNDNEAYWHEHGQIDVVSNTAEPILYRGVHYANSRDSYQPVDQILNVPIEKMVSFHLYGVEWDEQGIRFFLDDGYSKLIKFDHAAKGMFPKHQIRLQIGVGGRLFNKPMPEHFELMHWKCPAFIIDYVRIFEPIQIEDVQMDQLEECADIAVNNSEAVMSDVCERSMRLHSVLMTDKKDFVELAKSYWLPILIVLLLLLFLALITYLIYQITKIKRKVTKDANQMAMYEQANEYYENIYDDVNAYNLEPSTLVDPGNKLSYVQLQESIYPGNEYLEIKDADYRKSLGQGEIKKLKNDEYEDPDAPGEYETLAQPVMAKKC